MTKILIVKTSSLGDVIHNLPIVEDILAADPTAQIDWVVEENFADLVKMHPHVHQVIPVAWRRWRKRLKSRETWQEMFDFRYRLKKKHYDYVIDTQGLIKSGIITKMTNAKVKCGYSKEVAREPFAARFYNNHFLIPKNAHAIERNRWLASAALGYYANEHRLDYGIKTNVSEPIIKEPYVIFLHATSRTDKHWPNENWITLGHYMNKLGYKVVLPWGTDAEHEQALHIADNLANVYILPKLTLPDLAAVIEQTFMTVGVDTGLLHLSAAFFKMTVGIYTSSLPDLTGVYGSKTSVSLGGMGKIPTVDEVVEEVNRLITRHHRQ